MAYDQKFTHVVRFDNAEAAGLLDGVCYITPKLDGTNAVVWFDTEKQAVCAGSRNRELSKEADNAGFYAWVHGDHPEAVQLRALAEQYPHYIFYGEWGVGKVAHIKDYDSAAHGVLWLFDAYDTTVEEYLHPEALEALFQEHGLTAWSLPTTVVDHPTPEDLLELAQKNTFLLDTAGHAGEGVVIRRPEFRNSWGNYRIGKLVLDEFIQKKREKKIVVAGEAEQEIVQTFVTDAELVKAIEKVCGLSGVKSFDNHNGKMIGMYLNMVFHDAVMEDGILTYVKKHKNAVINFGELRRLTDQIARQYIGLK